MSSSPDAALAALAGSTAPFLIGVRHHSPALSVVIGELLDRFRPDVLLLELPAEFAAWLPWLADPATAAPVALAGVRGADDGPAFYPFADFSPELVAVRWAAKHGVEVVPCDLPLSSSSWRSSPAVAPVDGAVARSSFGDALRQAATGRPDEDMWDRVVEARAPGCDPEAVRRAALLVGWAMRTDSATGPGVSELDLRREAWMRRCLAAAGGRKVAAVVGSFHAAALLRGAPAEESAPAEEAAPDPAGVVTSLVPYSFALLDSRSGYPAGIRDPRWQQAVVGAAGRAEGVEAAALASIVEVCARVRAAGHPAGPAEAREVVRLASDLARLRGLPAPGRGEIVEALQSVLAHGEVLGRGRAVAAAMESVLVGDVRGALAPGAPRSGLRPAAEALLEELRLPGPGTAARDVRLDPLRSELDRRRDVALRRLGVCRIPYAEHTAVEGAGGVDALTTRWRIEWTPGTEAMLDVAGMRGVTLAQAAEGALRERRRREEGAEGPTAAQILAGLTAAAECGLPELAAERLAEVAELVPAGATLEELMAALGLLDRLRNGHIPGLPAGAATALADLEALGSTLEAAAVRQVDGLAGSDDLGDVRALVALGRRADSAGVGLRLAAALRRLTTDATPTMAAAAGAVEVLLGLEEPAALGSRVASWVDSAVNDDTRRRLLGHLRGLLAAAEPLLQSGPDALDALLDRVSALPDSAFLSRLPALRGGFQAVSPAGRERLLAVVRDRLGDGADFDGSEPDPAALLRRLLADRAGRAATEALGLMPAVAQPVREAGPEPRPGAAKPVTGELTVDAPAAGELAVLDRWRLLLGRQEQQMGPAARRYATALDELYGKGRGEGAAAEAAGRAGREAPFPNVREWAEELSALFGPGIREEVLARAAESGRRDAVMLLEPEAVNPSVELLQTVLSLAGGMPESSLVRLRPLVARIVEELTRRLATRLRPALAGISTPRPTYRPGGPLDLPRTLRANLATTRRGADGRVQVIPERPVFKTRARRGVDWRLVLVVDVSGSMEASIIWSALTGAILAGVPALTTHFVAFSTEVVDLTDRVSDPLSLLLEVQVGGGTHIAKGLRHARSLVTVPSRTLVAVVSDFEEGYPLSGLLAETRALVESGVTVLGCASLDDAGHPRYSVSVASQLVAAGMPVAALSPLELARWVAEKVRSS
ncbi:VWA domain-containing protein [Dactylosporangium vinaceum]|uniref:DUF5682 family protein n=1 Tax=Dactylosporangium vinaceum TaxID=53362 RepID=A0ABV5MHM6_9ACTN|nr:DUF5682 family protein [Dactylosporangium vinaceum]UAB99101.1 VWA domain-containing protein [Dactylosporangium vinaceum]